MHSTARGSCQERTRPAVCPPLPLPFSNPGHRWSASSSAKTSSASSPALPGIGAVVAVATGTGSQDCVENAFTCAAYLWQLGQQSKQPGQHLVVQCGHSCTTLTIALLAFHVLLLIVPPISITSAIFTVAMLLLLQLLLT